MAIHGGDGLKVRFIQKSTGKSLEIELVSHYTAILGLKSAEGKTWFYQFIRDELLNDAVSIESEVPCIFSDVLNIERDLRSPERSIIIIDELTLNRTLNLINVYNKAKHLIISISRTLPFNVNAPFQGIYTIKAVDGWFTCEHLEGLRFAEREYQFDIVITEARDGRSENQLIKQWRPDVYLVGAGGNIRVAMAINRIARKFPDKKILVLTDLFNIGQQYKNLIDVQSKCSNVKFYDYGSFEWMLFYSSFIKGTTRSDSLNFPTLEKYYESH